MFYAKRIFVSFRGHQRDFTTAAVNEIVLSIIIIFIFIKNQKLLLIIIYVTTYYINIIASVQILYIIMMSEDAAQTPRPIEIVNRIKLILFRARHSFERGKHRYIDNIHACVIYITNRFLNVYEIKNVLKKTYR